MEEPKECKSNEALTPKHTQKHDSILMHSNLQRGCSKQTRSRVPQQQCTHTPATTTITLLQSIRQASPLHNPLWEIE